MCPPSKVSTWFQKAMDYLPLASTTSFIRINSYGSVVMALQASTKTLMIWVFSFRYLLNLFIGIEWSSG